MSKKRRRLTPADEPFLLVRVALGGGEAGREIPAHAHAWGQLLYVVSGVVSLAAGDGAWTAPAGAAVWAAAGKTHALRFAAPSRFIALYLRPDVAETAGPPASRAVTPAPLLRALIEDAVARGALDVRLPAERAAAFLIADQIAAGSADAFALPLPASDALRRVAEAAASATAPLASRALARGAGMSLRTLERRFAAETGLTIGRWRARARMQRALELLAGGSSVKATAAALGYGGASAFVAAFRAAFGQSPGAYAAGRTRGVTRSAAFPDL